MRRSYAIWGAALVLYLVFLGWHENWRGPLTKAEIATFKTELETRGNLPADQSANLIAFLREDDGEEFFMVNIVGFPDGEVVHPDTGEKVDAQALLDSYYLPFAGKILARAGYPAFTALVQGGYIEAWGAAANPGWHAAGVMRYRSRRDLLASVNDPAFNDIHIYKRVALAATFAIPAKAIGGMLLSPRVWVALLIFAFAALVHITNLTVRKTNDR